LKRTRAVGSAADGPEASIVRVVVWIAENVAVEGVEGFGTKLERYALGDASPLDQAEVFFEIAEGAIVGLVRGLVAKGIGASSGDVGVGIAHAGRVVPEVRTR